jgi:hypothetical protein
MPMEYRWMTKLHLPSGRGFPLFKKINTVTISRLYIIVALSKCKRGYNVANIYYYYTIHMRMPNDYA